MSDLTGKYRYRRGWFGRLILQVQERYREVDAWGGFGATRWRDATVEDLTTEEVA